MDWTVYNFECTDVASRERFVSYFADNHPVTFPDDDTVAHEEVIDANGETRPGEFAWVEDTEYLYLTSLGPIDGILSMTAPYWERAVSASFDSTTETCREATLWESDGETVTELETWDGVAELGGGDILWRCAAEHDFRFRAYSEGPPTTITFAPIASAFDYIPPENIDSFASQMADATGVGMTDAALEFLREDPALLDEEEDEAERNPDVQDQRDEQDDEQKDEDDDGFFSKFWPF